MNASNPRLLLMPVALAGLAELTERIERLAADARQRLPQTERALAARVADTDPRLDRLLSPRLEA